MSSPKVVSCFKSHLTCDDMLPPRHPELRRLAHGDNFTDEELERRSTLRSRSVRLHSSIACRLQDTNMEYWKDWKDADSHCNSLRVRVWEIDRVTAGAPAFQSATSGEAWKCWTICKSSKADVAEPLEPSYPLAIGIQHDRNHLGPLVAPCISWNKALFAKPKGDVRSRPFNQIYSVSWRDVKMPKENFNGSSCVISSPPG